MTSMVSWIAIGVVGCLALVVVSGTGMMEATPNTLDEKGKCGGYLKKCDTNGNGRITCAEARKCGLKTPVTKDHPAYMCMTDRDKDGFVCE